MSDTYSVVLTKPLPSHLVGTKLGKMKLEQVIVEGLFIKKKLYYIRNSKNQEIIRSSGVDSSRLNYKLFLKLLNYFFIKLLRLNCSFGPPILPKLRFWSPYLKIKHFCPLF